MATCPGCGREIRDDIWVCGYCGELVACSTRASDPQPTRSVTGGGEPPPPAAPRTDVVGQVAREEAPSGQSVIMPTAPETGDPSPAGVMPTAPPPAAEPAPAGVMPTLPPSEGDRPGLGALPFATPAVAASGADASVGYPAAGFETHSDTAGDGEHRGTSKTIIIAAVLGFVAVAAVVAVWFFVLRGGPGGDLSPFVGDWQLTVPGASVTQTMVIEDVDGEGQLLFDVQGQRAGPYKLEFDGDRLATTFEPAAGASEEQQQAAEMIRSGFGSMVDDFKMVFSPGADADTLTMSVEGELKGAAGSMGDVSGQAVTLTRAPTTQTQ